MCISEMKCILKIFVVMNVLYTLNTQSKHNEKLDGLLYIALWTGTENVPFKNWQLEQKSFTTMNCEYQNCFIVDDIHFFIDVSKYDAILFNSIDLEFYTELPMVRADNQMYVFVSTESSANYPVVEKFNSFFNYTWTYKTDSDIHYPYFITRNRRGEVIAPKGNVKWININDMLPINDLIREKLIKKKTAAAWFVTNCDSKTRFMYLGSLRESLLHYKHNVDVFGLCEANKYCVNNVSYDCLSLLESDYYFYLSFEDSSTKDYVTEKLKNALDHYTVPVVMGGANYSKFMPDGIYLNANKLTEKEIAVKMIEAIRDEERYYEYFKWHEYYSYYMASESADTDPLCTFCAFLNDASNKNQRRTYAGFTDWWNDAKEMTRNIIVHYNQSTNKSVYKTFLNDERHKNITSEPLTEEEPSVMETAANIVGEIFRFYFY